MPAAAEFARSDLAGEIWRGVSLDLAPYGQTANLPLTSEISDQIWAFAQSYSQPRN